jgi:hypothetical protein
MNTALPPIRMMPPPMPRNPYSTLVKPNSPRINSNIKFISASSGDPSQPSEATFGGSHQIENRLDRIVYIPNEN